MGSNISRTVEFLKEQFEKSEYLSAHPRDKKYRLEHTMRVANIGRQIALGEGFDEDILVIGCLLHDLSYVETWPDEDGWLNHGRRAAQLARPFLETLDLSQEQIDEICYGIAIHVDDEADFPGERSPLAVSVGDADNIDRFDVYRIHENLQHRSFLELPYDEQLDFAAQVLQKLEKYRELEFATKTATKLWQERIDFQIQFFTRLKAQLDASKALL
ncbi:MAG TPA: HD domain-containing protein [Firmicutes bacterium]|jgi:HD superfamily phosphodiesterase|nr:HD domain-containing protein [Bacillota bacterium]HHT43343.1 HD domain-containing protein [Bacillota bacterium]